MRDNLDVVTFRPAVLGTALIIPAGLLKPGFVYRIDATLRLRASWSYAYNVLPWDRPALFTSSFRRAEGVNAEAEAEAEVAAHADADADAHAHAHAHARAVNSIQVAEGQAGFQYNASDVVFDIQASSAMAPLLYVHAPPFGGAVTAAPALGMALQDAFSFGTSGWVSLNGAALSSIPPVDPVAAGSMLGSAAWPPALVDALSAVTLGTTSTAPLRDRVLNSGISVSSACGSYAFSAWAVLPVNAPAWLRAQRAVADALSVSQPDLCKALVGIALYVSSLMEVSGSSSRYPAPAPLVYAWRVDNTLLDGAQPLGIAQGDIAFNGVVTLSALVQPSVLKRLISNSTWPGVPISKPSGTTSASVSWLASPTGGAAGAVAIIALASDDVGCTGLAVGSVLVSPPLTGADAISPAKVTTLAGSIVATITAAGLAEENPSLAILTVGQVSDLLSAAPAGNEAAVAAEATAARTALAGILRDAVMSLGDKAVPDASGVRIDDATLKVAIGSLANLMSRPSETSTEGLLSSLDATVAGLALAVPMGPNAGGNVTTTAISSAFAAATPLSSAVGNLSLAVIGNAVVASTALVAAAAGPKIDSVPNTGAFPYEAAASLSTESAAPAADKAVVALTQTIVASLSQALLRGATVGSVFSVASTGVAKGDGGNASTCGSDVALTVARVSVSASGAGAGAGGAASSISMGAPLSPCRPAGTVTLPAAVVAAAAPPSVALGPSTLAAIAFAAGGAPSVDVQLLQWGASPVSEGKGFSSITYAAPSPVPRAARGVGGARSLSYIMLGESRRAEGALSTTLRASIDLFGAAVSAGSMGGGGGDDRVRSSSRSRSLFARLATTVETIADSLAPTAGSASAAAYASAVQIPTTSRDALPGRPLDTRIVSITISTSAGVVVPVASTTSPILITLPLRDMSLPSYFGGKIGGYELLPGWSAGVVNITCPSSVGENVRALFVSPAALKGRVSEVKIVNATPIFFSTSVKDSEVLVASSPVSSDVERFVTVRDPAKTAAQTAAALTLANSTISAANIRSYAYTLSVDCGAPAGVATVFCGAGQEGRTIAYQCPSLKPQPVCLWWDVKTTSWSSAGCIVNEVTETSVICACNHLTDFAARMAAVPNPGANYFYSNEPLSLFALIAWVNSSIGIASALFVGFLVALVIGYFSDYHGSLRFSRVLAADQELRFLAKMRGIAGRPLVLDRLAPEITACEADTDFPIVKKAAPSAVLHAAMMSMQGVTPESLTAVSERASRELHNAERAIEAGSTSYIIMLFGRRFYDFFDRTPATIDGALTSVALAAKAYTPKDVDEYDEGALNNDEHENDDDDERERKAHVRARASKLAHKAAKASESVGEAMKQFATAIFLLFDITIKRMPYTHAAMSLFTRYDPFLSRHNRALGLAAMVMGHLFWACVFYSFIVGMPTSIRLRSATAAEFGLVFFCTAFASAPLDALIWHLLRIAGRAEFRWRYVELYAEIARRREAEYYLNCMSTPALADGIDVAAALPKESFGEEHDADAHAGGPVGDYLRAAVNAGLLNQAALLMREAERAARTAERASAPTHYDDDEEADADNDGHDSVASGSSLLAPEDDEANIFEAKAMRFWTDPPRAVQVGCASIVFCCGRSMLQKGAYVERRETNHDLTSSDALHYMLAAGALPARAKPRHVCCGVCVSFRPPLPAVSLSKARKPKLFSAGKSSSRVAPMGYPAASSSTAGDIFTEAMLNASNTTRSDAVSEALLFAKLLEINDDTDIALRDNRLCSCDVLTRTICAPRVGGRTIAWTLGIGCTGQTAGLLIFIWFYLIFAFFFVIAFNLVQPATAVTSVCGAWALAMFLTTFLLQPIGVTLALYASFVLWPALAELVAWIPSDTDVLGATRAVRERRMQAAEGVLTSRLERIAVMHAVVAASGVPDKHVVAAVMLDVFCVAAVDPTSPPPAPDAERMSARVALRRALILRRYVLLHLRAVLGLYASEPQALAAAALLAHGDTNALARATIPFAKLDIKTLRYLAGGDEGVAEDLDYALVPQSLIEAVDATMATAPAQGSKRVHSQNVERSRRVGSERNGSVDEDNSDDDEVVNADRDEEVEDYDSDGPRSMRSGRSAALSQRSAAANRSAIALSVAPTPTSGSNPNPHTQDGDGTQDGDDDPLFGDFTRGVLGKRFDFKEYSPVHSTVNSPINSQRSTINSQRSTMFSSLPDSSLQSRRDALDKLSPSMGSPSTRLTIDRTMTGRLGGGEYALSPNRPPLMASPLNLPGSAIKSSASGVAAAATVRAGFAPLQVAAANILGPLGPPASNLSSSRGGFPIRVGAPRLPSSLMLLRKKSTW